MKKYSISFIFTYFLSVLLIYEDQKGKAGNEKKKGFLKVGLQKHIGFAILFLLTFFLYIILYT